MSERRCSRCGADLAAARKTQKAPQAREEATSEYRPGLSARRTVRLCSMSAPQAASPIELAVFASSEERLEQAKAVLLQAPLRLSRDPAAAQQQPVVLSFTQPVERSASSFDPASYFHALGGCALGSTLLTTTRLPSTQTLLQENSGRIPDGCVCVADVQLSGKGRGQNVWDSPEGCLMFSLCTKLSIQGQWLPFVQYAASLAIVQAITQRAGERLQGEALDVRIKWPNDIYARGLKVGGVLCQSAYRVPRFDVTVGVGLNLSNAAPTTCLNALLRDAAAAQGGGSGGARNVPEITREELLAAIMQRMEELLGILCKVGFRPLKGAYLASWLHTGQEVVLEDRTDDGVAAPARVTITGLSDAGYLLARGAGGAVCELHPDGNSLDFFKGLIRKKPLP